jgi:hypothetical protein
MTLEDFKRQVEQPIVTNAQRMINSNSAIEEEFYRSNKVTIGAVIARTMRLTLTYPDLAKEYYNNQPKAVCDEVHS